MTAEARRGKEFTQRQKKKAKEEAGYCCQACGKKIDGKANHSHEGLQVHHDPPITKGGDRRSKPWVLDQDCHRVVDMLAIDRDISLTTVKEKLGERPLEPYSSRIRRGKLGKVVRRISQRITKAG